MLLHLVHYYMQVLTIIEGEFTAILVLLYIIIILLLHMLHFRRVVSCFAAYINVGLTVQ